MSRPLVLVTSLPSDDARAAVEDVLASVAEIAFQWELAGGVAESAIRAADAVITYNPMRDLGTGGIARLDNCRLIQCLTAGIDWLSLNDLPADIPIAYNAGAFAEPMAEHVLAMALAAAKRLRVEHINMQGGAFNQFVWTKRVAGLTCGILGYGETGRAVARLMRPLGIRIHAINRSGRTDDEVAFIGTLDDLDTVLAAADIVVITLSLTRRTFGLIDARRLSRMKPDAILVNVARGEIVDEDALYAHLLANPEFSACLEAWWVEPIRHGRFSTRHPFLDLPNVIASPHNSGMTPGALVESARRGAQNVRRMLTGEGARFIAGEDERLR